MNPNGEAPFTHVRDCSGKPTARRGLGGGKPDLKGNALITTYKTAFKHTLKKGRLNIPKFRPYDIYL